MGYTNTFMVMGIGYTCRRKTEMSYNDELETDAISEEQLEDWAGTASRCNGWSFWYLDNVNEDAVVLDIWVAKHGIAHCVVYDPDLDATIDPTLGQFDGLPDSGAWDGKHHPYHAEEEEIREWTDREAFGEEYDYCGSPFIV